MIKLRKGSGMNWKINVGAVFGLLMAASSHGLMWQDYDYLGVFLEEGESYTGVFDLTTPDHGYDPNQHEITYARVGFSFSDGYRHGDSGGEWVDIWLDTNQLWNNKEVDGTHRYGYDWIWRGLNGVMLTDLQDGVLSYTVQVENRLDGKNNDVWLKQAKLKAWGQEVPDGHGVPDGGASIALFVLSLASLFLFGRRMARA